MELQTTWYLPILSEYSPIYCFRLKIIKIILDSIIDFKKQISW